MNKKQEIISKLKAYIEDNLPPVEHKKFMDQLDESEENTSLAVNSFLAKPENKEWQIRFNKKQETYKNRQENLLNYFNTYRQNPNQNINLDDDLILDYLSGFSSNKEEQLISNFVAEFPEAKNYIDSQKELLELINEPEEDSLRSMITSTDAKMEQESFYENLQTPEEPASDSVKKLDTRRYLLIAASITLLLVAGWFLFRPGLKDINTAYADHHNKETHSIVHLLDKVGTSGIGTPGHSQAALKTPLQLYLSDQYDQAIPLLRNFITENPNDLDATFALGLCLEENGQLNAAQEIYRQVTTSSSEWKDEAQYLLAMIYLQSPETRQEGKTLLEEVSNQTEATFQNKAKEILGSYAFD